MIQPGDILAVRGSGWLSTGILSAEYGPNIPATGVSHVGIFVAGDPVPIVIEALNQVMTNPLAVSVAGAAAAFVLHDDSLTIAQRSAIVAVACTFSGKNYGYIDLLAQGLDAITNVLWFTNNLGGYLRHYPICSFVAAQAYDAVGLHFGIPDASIKPSDIMNFAQANPSLYTVTAIPVTAATRMMRGLGAR